MSCTQCVSSWRAAVRWCAGYGAGQRVLGTRGAAACGGQGRARAIAAQLTARCVTPHQQQAQAEQPAGGATGVALAARRCACALVRRCSGRHLHYAAAAATTVAIGCRSTRRRCAAQTTDTGGTQRVEDGRGGEASGGFKSLCCGRCPFCTCSRLGLMGWSCCWSALGGSSVS
jgi:hypothetical protein